MFGMYGDLVDKDTKIIHAIETGGLYPFFRFSFLDEMLEFLQAIAA